MVAKGWENVPGPESLPLGATKKSALGVGVMVTVAEADLVVSATEVAVTVTVLGLGTVAGAVYEVVTPLAVLAGLKEPQAPVGVQVQVTPAESLTAAAMLAVAVTAMVPGGAGWRVTEITGGGVMAGVELPPPQPACVSRQTPRQRVQSPSESFAVRSGITCAS
jgi:hypothetical protein